MLHFTKCCHHACLSVCGPHRFHSIAQWFSIRSVDVGGQRSSSAAPQLAVELERLCRTHRLFPLSSARGAGRLSISCDDAIVGFASLFAPLCCLHAIRSVDVGGQRSSSAASQLAMELERLRQGLSEGTISIAGLTVTAARFHAARGAGALGGNAMPVGCHSVCVACLVFCFCILTLHLRGDRAPSRGAGGRHGRICCLRTNIASRRLG